MNRHFTEEGIQMASKYMKMCHQRSKKSEECTLEVPCDCTTPHRNG